ncbi:hypothetical protein F66182_9006 [Fusarium sp. NRRL 66182]|nr:hypothetical protein F66182_9006 [Fusarium sp. NRRL 66182]
MVLPIKVIDGDKPAPQDSIFGLKTRSAMVCGKDILGGQPPRSWTTQVTQFLIAYHERSVFKDENADMKNPNTNSDEWQDQNQPSLYTLRHPPAPPQWHVQRWQIRACLIQQCSFEVREQLPGTPDLFSDPVRRDWESESYPADSGWWEEVMAALPDSDGTRNYAACDEECGYCGKCVF